MKNVACCALCASLLLAASAFRTCPAEDRTSYEYQQSLRLANRVDALEEKVDAMESPQTTSSDGALNWSWSKGLRLQTADGNFKFKFGGRLMFDFGTISQDDDNRTVFGDIDNSGEFRRARLYISGDIYSDAFFKAQFDFAGGDVDLKDLSLIHI